MIIKKLKEFKSFLIDLWSYLFFLFYSSKYKLNLIGKDPKRDEVTVVILSCGRPKLLDFTLGSFIKYNTFKIKKYIFIEDSGSVDCVKVFKKNIKNLNRKIIFHKSNKGQLASIDEAYSLVETKYVFYLEDDWQFFRSGFIEYSMKLFKSYKKLCSVSIRPHSDWKRLDLQKKINKFHYKFLKKI